MLFSQQIRVSEDEATETVGLLLSQRLSRVRIQGYGLTRSPALLLPEDQWEKRNGETGRQRKLICV